MDVARGSRSSSQSPFGQRQHVLVEAAAQAAARRSSPAAAVEAGLAGETAEFGGLGASGEHGAQHDVFVAARAGERPAARPGCARRRWPAWRRRCRGSWPRPGAVVWSVPGSCSTSAVGKVALDGLDRLAQPRRGSRRSSSSSFSSASSTSASSSSSRWHSSVQEVADLRRQATSSRHPSRMANRVAASWPSAQRLQAAAA